MTHVASPFGMADEELPKGSVGKLIKENLPEGVKVSEGAKDLIADCGLGT